MKLRSSVSRPILRTGVRAALLLGALAATARAGDPEPWLYTLDDLGRLRVGGTLLEELSGGFDPSDLQDPEGSSRWMAFAVDGADRWALRLDGRIESEGTLVGMAPFAIVKFTPYWLRLGQGAGETWALRTDGLLARDGTALALLPDDNRHFTDLIVIDEPPAEPVVLSLRSDGAVFTGTTLTPLYELVGGDGLFSKSDGFTIDTTWLRLAWDATSGLVFALRADGKVRSLDPAGPPPPPPPPGDDEELGPEAGEAVAELPFKKKPPFGVRHLYVDLAFTDDGTFHVLRTDGRVYRADDVEEPLVDLPGDGRRAAVRFVDIVARGDTFWALRRDGRVYRGLEGQLLDLPGGRAVQLALSDDPPSLAGSVSHPPSLPRWKARAVAGEALALPVLSVDVDLDAGALTVEADLSDAPDASFDGDAREVVIDAPQPGKQRARLSVDDGDVDPVEAVFRVVVVAPHDGPANRAPLPARVSPVTALVGHELELPVLAVDPDGDELAFASDADDTPYALGASFDADARLFTWTPPLAAVGKHVLRFTISDGQGTRTLAVRVLVESSLVP